jgi:DNA-binding transcriptional LysR family regulator
MDIHHLRYFIEVARQGSFSKAAQTLHVSQPSISKMIKALEDELDVSLLSRSTRQVELTDAGVVVLREAQRIVDAFENLRFELADVMELRTGSLVIGLPPMVGASFFAKTIGEFYRRNPGISIKLIEVGSKQVEKGVESGELDLGVVALPVKSDMVNTLSFYKEKISLIVPCQHVLAEKQQVSLEELKNESIALFRDDFSLHDIFLENCAQLGFEPKIICESSQWDFLAELVAAGLGVSFLPQTICQELDPARIKNVLLVGPEMEWHLAIIWEKDRYLSFAAREWLDFVQKNPPLRGHMSKSGDGFR